MFVRVTPSFRPLVSMIFDHEQRLQALEEMEFVEDLPFGS